MATVRTVWALALVATLAGTAGDASAQEAERDGVTFDEEGFTARFGDGAAQLNIGGRLYLDAADAWVDPDFDPFEDHTEIRQARIEPQLTIADRLTFVFQYDFADETSPIKDAGAGLKATDRVVLSVGNFKEPFSLEELTSDNDIDLMERSLADTFAPARAFGGAVTGHGERWTAALGVFGGDINDDIADDGFSVTGRVTFAPVNTDDRLVHLGLAGSYRDTDGVAASFSSGPEASLFQTSLVDTGSIAGTSEILRGGLEGLVQAGRLRLQGEYEVARVGRDAAEDVTFQGAYLTGGWTINGDGRPYKTEDAFGTELGVLGGVKLREEQKVHKGGIGVFEAVARVSAIGLDDADIAGGSQWNAALGLNWYPETNLRLMANYVHAEAEDSPAVGGDADADIIQGRIQIAF